MHTYFANTLCFYYSIPHLLRWNIMLKLALLLYKNKPLSHTYEVPFYYLFSISCYQEFDFLISRKTFPDTKKCISWYQEFDFLISRKTFPDTKKCISWYQEFDFLISRKNTDFLISRNRIPDIKKSFLDIKKSISWYQEMYSEAPFNYLLSISWYQEFISWYQEI